MANDVDTQALNAALQAAAAAARDLAREHSALVSDIRTHANRAADALGDVAAAAKKTQSVEARANTIRERATKSIEEETRIRDELNELTEKANKLAAEGNTESAEYLELMKKINDVTAKSKAASANSSKALHELSTHQRNASITTKAAGIALQVFGTTILAGIANLKEQYKAQNGVIEGSGNVGWDLLTRQVKALTHAMSPADFEKQIAAQRQMVNAMGGTDEALKTLDPAFRRFTVLTGDSASAMELAAQSASDFASKGVHPTQQALGAYTNDIVQMTKYTGMSAEATRSFYADIADDGDSIHLLRSAREDEREAILQSQRALIQQSIAVGMTSAKAKEAAKMLNKMVAAKPLDRLKQAAKIRAMGAAMGVAGSEEAAQAVIAGPRASAEQKTQLQQFSQSMTNAVDSMAGQGMSAEIFASTLTEKMGLEEQYGPSSPFSTTLGMSLEPVKKAIDKLHDASVGPQGEILKTLIKISDTLGVLLSGAFLPLAIAAGVVGVLPKMGAILKNVWGGLGGGAAGATPGPEGKPGPGGKLGKLGKIGGKALAAGGKALVGGGLGYITSMAGEAGGTALEEAGHTKSAAAAKIAGRAGTGAMIGSFIPGVGTLVGGTLGAAYGTVENWGQLTGGDKPPAESAAAAKIAGRAGTGAMIGSFIPGVGTLGAAYGTVENWGQLTGGDKPPAGAPAQATKLSRQSSSLSDKADSKETASILAALTSTSDGVHKQIEQMTTSNTLLQQLADVSTKQVEIAEKQLIALTMTETDKANSSIRSYLRADNKFGSQYGYV